MKKLRYNLACMLILGALLGTIPASLSAQDNTDDLYGQGYPAEFLQGTNPGDAGRGGDIPSPQYVPGSLTAPPPPVTRSGATQTPTREPVEGCTSIFNARVETCAARLLYHLFLAPVAWIVWLTGAVFDYAISYTLNMREFLSKVQVVDIGWRVFRDLANIFFIFALLWVALTTILNVSSANVKKFLINLVVMALLINFSLFITQAIVDGSNIISLHFYSLMTGGSSGGSISATVMEGLKLQTLYADPSAGGGGGYFADKVGGILNIGKLILLALLGAPFMLVTAFVFAAAAILFIIRAVVLMFLMMTSPIAFIGEVLPGVAAQAASRWWKELWCQCLWAPIYMALLYIVVKTINSGGFHSLTALASNRETFAAAVTSNAPGGVALIVAYIILILVLLGSLIVAKTLGCTAGGVVIGWGQKVRRAGQGFVGRHTVGRAARYLEERAQTSPFWSGRVGSKIREFTTTPLSGAKFGGKLSAYEMKRKEKVRKAGEEDALLIARLREEAAKPPTPSGKEMQLILARLSPSAYSHLDMKDFEKTPALARFATGAQIQGLMASDKTETEKDRVIDLRLKHITDAYLKYNEARKRWYEKLERGEITAGTKLEDAGVGWTKEYGDTVFGPAMDDLRGKSVKELELYNRIRPELFSDGYLPSTLNWWQITGMRQSEGFTYTQREGNGSSARDLKDQNLLNAMDILIGNPFTDTAGNWRPLEERFRGRYDILKVWNAAIEKGEAALSPADRAVWERIKAIPEAKRRAAYELMTDHYANRSFEEMTKSRGGIRRSPPAVAFFPSGTGKFMAGKDSRDPIALTRDYLRWYSDNTLTVAAKGFLRWMLFDREGRNFYPKWEELAGEMRIPQATVNRLKEYQSRGAAGMEAFERETPTLSFLDALPGATRRGGGGSAPPPAGGAGGGGGGAPGGGVGGTPPASPARGGGGRVPGGGRPGTETPEERARRGGIV